MSKGDAYLITSQMFFIASFFVESAFLDLAFFLLFILWFIGAVIMWSIEDKRQMLRDKLLLARSALLAEAITEAEKPKKRGRKNGRR